MPFLRSIFVLMLLSISFLSNAADLAKGLACHEKQDYQCALAEVRPSAEQGDALAQYALGLMYANGQGVKQDYIEAVKWTRKAAEQGDALAQNTLGFAYLTGKGVKEDMREAKRWFGLACDNQDQMACDNYRKLNQEGY
jgi:TPR repeat protein